MSFIARWDSKHPCPVCEEQIKVGERAEFVGDEELQHVSCEPPAPRPVCTDCFMEIALNGACSC